MLFSAFLAFNVVHRLTANDNQLIVAGCSKLPPNMPSAFVLGIQHNAGMSGPRKADRYWDFCRRTSLSHIPVLNTHLAE